MAKEAKALEIVSYLFLCDGAIAPTRNSKQKVAILKTGKKRVKDEIHLEIGALKEHLKDNLPDVMKDLLEIATFVYAAGQLASRGGLKELDYGYKWHREFDLAIPVRQYDVWTDARTKEQLEDLLSFVAGEHYTFHFTQKQKENPEFLELQDSREDPNHIQEVILFSGGMDSFAGAVDEIDGQKKKIALVSHCSEPKMKSLQKNVFQYLRKNCAGPMPLHVPVHIYKGGHYITKDTNQRSRSFLYASLGALVATTLGLKHALFYENGIISCNLPFDNQTPQARRTRSTHPKFLAEMGELVKCITGEEFQFKNPYFFMTRTDIVNRIISCHKSEGITITRSCAKSRYSGPRHDGVCSQCVDRRFSTIAAQCLEYDPQKDYKIDIFKDELENTHDRTMALGYTYLADHIGNLDKESFCEHFSSDLYEITNHMAFSQTEAITNIYNLYRNHSNQVNGVLSEQIKQHTNIVMKGKPRNCLLSMVAHQDHQKYSLRAKQKKEGVKKRAKGQLDKEVQIQLDKNPKITAAQIAENIGNTSAEAVRQTQSWKNRNKN